MECCSECNRPLFDQKYSPDDSGLCDNCWRMEVEGEMDDGAYDEMVDNELS